MDPDHTFFFTSSNRTGSHSSPLRSAATSFSHGAYSFFQTCKYYHVHCVTVQCTCTEAYSGGNWNGDSGRTQQHLCLLRYLVCINCSMWDGIKSPMSGLYDSEPKTRQSFEHRVLLKGIKTTGGSKFKVCYRPSE